MKNGRKAEIERVKRRWREVKVLLLNGIGGERFVGYFNLLFYLKIYFMPISPVYGRAISKSEADGMYQSFKEVKTRYYNALNQAIGQDSETKRYFLGNDVAFVFQKNTLDALFSRLTNEKDCIVLFAGTRYDSVDKVNGRPTVMAFVYNVRDDESGFADINLGSDTDIDDGYEHPGNFRVNLSIPSEIPETISLNDVTFVS